MFICSYVQIKGVVFCGIQSNTLYTKSILYTKHKLYTFLYIVYKCTITLYVTLYTSIHSITLYTITLTVYTYTSIQVFKYTSIHIAYCIHIDTLYTIYVKFSLHFYLCEKTQILIQNLFKITNFFKGIIIPWKNGEVYTFFCIFIHKKRETIENTAL